MQHVRPPQTDEVQSSGRLADAHTRTQRQCNALRFHILVDENREVCCSRIGLRREGQGFHALSVRLVDVGRFARWLPSDEAQATGRGAPDPRWRRRGRFAAVLDQLDDCPWMWCALALVRPIVGRPRSTIQEREPVRPDGRSARRSTSEADLEHDHRGSTSAARVRIGHAGGDTSRAVPVAPAARRSERVIVVARLVMDRPRDDHADHRSAAIRDEDRDLGHPSGDARSQQLARGHPPEYAP